MRIAFPCIVKASIQKDTSLRMNSHPKKELKDIKKASHDMVEQHKSEFLKPQVR